MFRRVYREAGQWPGLPREIDSPISNSCKYLLAIGAVSLGLCTGCTATSSGWRAFAFTPRQTVRPEKSLRQPEDSAGTVAAPVAQKPADKRRAVVEQVSAQQEAADPSGPTEVQKVATEPETPQAISELQNSAGISLQDLEAIALQYNPTLCQSQAAINAQQSIYVQDGLYPNPSIGYLNGSASRPGVKQSNGIFVSQEIVTSQKLQLAQQAEAVEIQRYSWDYEAQKQRILNDLRIRYYEALGAQESLAVTEGLVKIAQHSLEMAQKRMEGIHGTKTDLLQAQVQLESVLLMRDEAEHRYEGAWDRLATMTGATWLKPTHLNQDMASTIPVLNMDSSLQNLTNSPQLRSIECDLGHAWATYREEQALAVPNVTVQAVAEYDQAMQASIVTTLVAMPLPIHNRNQGNIAKSAAEIVEAQQEISRVKLLQREHLSDAFQIYKDNLKKADRLQKVILKAAEENLKLTQQVYESGEIGFAPVLIAQQSYFHSQLEYVTALTEVHKAAASIDGFLLSGGLNPAEIGGAIQNQPGGGSQRQRALLGDLQDKSSRQLLPAAQISQ